MKYLAISSRGMYVQVLDFETNHKIFDFESYEVLDSTNISQDNKYLILGCASNVVKVIDLETKQTVGGLQIRVIVNEGSTRTLKVTNDDKTIISYERDFISVCDSDTMQEIHCYQNVSEGWITSLKLSSDNQYMVFASEQGTLKVKRITKQQEGYNLAAPTGSDGYILHADIVQGTGYAAVAYSSGSLKIFDMQTKEQIEDFNFGVKCNFIDISSSESRIIAAVVPANMGEIKIYDIKQKKEVVLSFQVQDEKSRIRSLKLSKDCKSLAAMSFQDTRQEKWRKANPAASLDALTVSNNNKYVFVGESYGSIQIYDFQTGESVYNFVEAHYGELTKLVVSSDSKYLISVSKRRTSIKMFDIETKQEVLHLEQDIRTRVRAVDISSDNKFIIFTTENPNALKIYDIQAKKDLKEIEVGNVGFDASISEDNKNIFTMGTVLPTGLGGHNYISSNIPFNSVFTGYDDFITSLWPKELEMQKYYLTHFKDMYVYPHNWTLLHLLAIFQPSAISLLPEYAQFKVNFLVDSYEKTPLDYLLAQKNRDYTIINIMLKYILDYLEDEKTTTYQRQTVCASLADCFLFIISRASPSLIHRYLKICYPESPLQYGQVLPSFGVCDQKYAYSQVPVVNSEVFEKLYQNGDERLIFKTNMISMDYDPRSQDMFDTTHVLSEIQEESIFKSPIIETLIDHMWETTKTTMYITASVFSILMILFSLYIISGENSIVMEISIILLTTVFMVSEAYQAIVLGKEYVESVWNCIDFTQLVLTLIFMFAKIESNGEILGEAWIVSTIIITGYLRWLSYLRLFTPTRILIEIILVVLFDMLGFITIIAGILVGFSVIFLEFGKYQDVPQEYGFHFYNAFKLLFGNYDDTDYSLSQIILVSFLLCVLNVVLLNLLIAIIGDSYGKVQEGRDLIDAKTRIEMIQEAMILMRKLKPKTTNEKGYLIYRSCAVVEEGNSENREWEARINRIENTVKQEMKSLNEQVNQMKTEMKGNAEEAKNHMGDQINQIKAEVKQNNDQVRGEIKSMGQ